MRADYVLILTDITFFTLAIFFSGLTIQVADPNLKTQLVALASSFFVGGVVIVIALVLLYIFKIALSEKRAPQMEALSKGIQIRALYQSSSPFVRLHL